MSTLSCHLQQKLAQMLSRLIKIAEEFNVAVYMTNQGKATQPCAVVNIFRVEVEDKCIDTLLLLPKCQYKSI